jgi:hypothetical protein
MRTIAPVLHWGEAIVLETNDTRIARLEPAPEPEEERKE